MQLFKIENRFTWFNQKICPNFFLDKKDLVWFSPPLCQFGLWCIPANLKPAPSQFQKHNMLLCHWAGRSFGLNNILLWILMAVSLHKQIYKKKKIYVFFTLTLTSSSFFLIYIGYQIILLARPFDNSGNQIVDRNSDVRLNSLCASAALLSSTEQSQRVNSEKKNKLYRDINLSGGNSCSHL